MKIIILVLSDNVDERYINLEKCIRNTWGDSSIDTYYYYGGNSEFSVTGDIINCISDEGLYNIGYKTIESFEYLNNLDFDYIFRTNSSSYVHVDRLIEFLENKPKNDFYCGYINKCVVSGLIFGSGSGYFLSSDLVSKVISEKENWNHELIDDVALGDLLINKMGVKIIQSKRCDIDSIIDDEFYCRGKKVSNIDGHFHFRCKTPTKERNLDIDIMNKLHRIF